MNAYALHDSRGDIWLRRWGLAAAAILAAHAAMIALGMSWVALPPPGVAVPAVLVDLTPITSAPEISKTELPPGPAMQEADAAPPEPAAAQAVHEEIAPTPLQEKAEVAAPPEQKPQVTPPKPEPTKVVPEHKTEPVKPKVVRRDAKKPSEATPAPRASAPSRAERQAPAASAISAGAAASAIAAYNARVRAPLLRFHSYPADGIRDVLDRLARPRQTRTGIADAQPDDVVGNRCAHVPAKQPVRSGNAECRDAGKFLQPDLPRIGLVDVGQHPVDARASRVALHRHQSLAGKRLGVDIIREPAKNGEQGKQPLRRRQVEQPLEVVGERNSRFPRETQAGAGLCDKRGNGAQFHRRTGDRFDPFLREPHHKCDMRQGRIQFLRG